MAAFSLEVSQQSGRWVPPAFVFCASLVVYVLTLCPTVYVGDSGEFITNAVTLGINHPTGYPLYTILTRLWLLITPFGTPSYAVNLFSAVASSLTVVCVYFVLQLLTSRRSIATLVALLLAFSSTFWARATSAEVYGLNSLFVALSILVILRWSRDRELKQLVFVAYLAGLGLSQHVTGALVAFSLFLFILLTDWRAFFKTRVVLLLVISFSLGFSSYLYMPIRSLANPPIEWGDLRTVVGFFHQLLPVSRRGLAPYFGEGTESRLFWFIQQASTKEFWYFGPLSLFGVVALSGQWRLLVSLLSVCAINVLFTINRAMPLHADFDASLVPTYIVMAIFIGVGLARGLDFVEKKWRRFPAREVQLVSSLALFLIVLTTANANFSRNDRSRNFFGHDFGRNVFQPIEQDAIVFTIGDEQTFLGWYFKYVEKVYPRASFIDTRLLGTPWGVRLFNREFRLPIQGSVPPDRIAEEIIRSNIGHRPIYFTHRLPWEFLLRTYDMLPLGMLIQILPKASRLDYRPVDFIFHQGWEAVYLDDRCRLLVDFYPKEYIDHAQFWLNHQNESAAQAELNHFFSFPYRINASDNLNAFLMQGLIYYRRGEVARAENYADSALTLNPTDWRALEYRGTFRVLKKDTAGALADWQTSLRLNPNNANVRHYVEDLSKIARPKGGR